MKKTHLRWLVPLILCTIAVGILLVYYEQSVFDQLVHSKETEIALSVREELSRIDQDITRAEAVVSNTGGIMNRFRMDDNRSQLVYMLGNIIEESPINHAILCDMYGVGFDDGDNDVDISGESYFDKLSSEYANGGTGMILPSGGQSEIGEVLLVYGTKFSSRTRGYLVTFLPIKALDEQLFREKFISDSQAIIALSGEILCSRGFDNVSSASSIIWDKMPKGLTKESVKLAISQKNTYMTKVPDYGYAIVAPLYSAGGGAVVFISDAQMRLMIGDELAASNNFSVIMVIISLAFVALVLLADYVSDRIVKKMEEKKLTGKELDVVTGLLSGSQTLREIDEFAANGPDQRGILFVIGTNLSVKGDDSSRGNDSLREFARVLGSGFRSSDVIGRTGENEFTVFLKGIREEKDIRKQTDEMQLFLHDVNSDGDAEGLTASAGAVLFPDGGKNAREIMDAGRKALVRARQQGYGRLSF